MQGDWTTAIASGAAGPHLHPGPLRSSVIRCSVVSSSAADTPATNQQPQDSRLAQADRYEKTRCTWSLMVCTRDPGWQLEGVHRSG